MVSAAFLAGIMTEVAGGSGQGSGSLSELTLLLALTNPAAQAPALARVSMWSTAAATSVSR